MKKLLVLLLATLMLCFVSCGEDESVVNEYYPIEWDMLTGLPEDFPKLCDGVTSTEENSALGSVSVYWNVIEKSVFEDYLVKVEKWAGKDFAESVNEGNGAITYTLETDKYKVEAAFNANNNGDHIEGHLYNAQARISVVNK